MARRRLSLWLAALALLGGGASAETLRVATFNAALSRPAPGALVQEMRLGDKRQIAAVAEIIQRVRPDILLINEIDHDPDGESARAFAQALRRGQGGAEGIDYPHVFTAPVNTGVLSGFDLDGDGAMTRPRDAFGYGLHEGHYGMALFSRLPLGAARSFRLLRWAAMPENRMPPGRYPPEAAAALRLSSKSHWDVAVLTAAGPLHILASHPTPPVFDPANAGRNADEIRFWVDYLDGAGWIVDDAGLRGAAAAAPFVLLGDLNADPADGAGADGATRRTAPGPTARSARCWRIPGCKTRNRARRAARRRRRRAIAATPRATPPTGARMAARAIFGWTMRCPRAFWASSARACYGRRPAIRCGGWWARGRRCAVPIIGWCGWM